MRILTEHPFCASRSERLVQIDMTSNPTAGISLSRKNGTCHRSQQRHRCGCGFSSGQDGSIRHRALQLARGGGQRDTEETARHGVGGDIVQAELSSRNGVDSLCSFASFRAIDIQVNNDDAQPDQRLFPVASGSGRHGRARERRHHQQSSVAARFGGGLGAIASSSAKTAVSTMTKGLTKEFAPHGVRVNCISPGTIDTSYHRTFSTSEGLDGVRRHADWQVGNCRGDCRPGCLPRKRQIELHSRTGDPDQRRLLHGVTPVKVNATFSGKSRNVAFA